MAHDPIRQALDAGETLSNVWIMLGSGLSLEIAAHAGWDTVPLTCNMARAVLTRWWP